MPRFLALYTGDPVTKTTSTPPDADTIARGQRAWGEWMAKHAGQVVDVGGPPGATKEVTARGISDISNTIAAYVIVDAEDHEAAAKMFLDHPHFTIFPGRGVEVMPLLPIPVT